MRRARAGNPWPAVPAVALVLLLPAVAAAADAGAAPGAAPTPPPNAAAPEAKPKPPQNLEPMGPQAALALLGQKVWGPGGEDMGLVVNILVDNDGHPRAAIIDFGGFLGVGTRKIAIDWRLLHFKPADPKSAVRLSLGRAELQAAPEYKPSSKPDQPVEVVGPPSAARSVLTLPNGEK